MKNAIIAIFSWFFSWFDEKICNFVENRTTRHELKKITYLEATWIVTPIMIITFFLVAVFDIRSRPKFERKFYFSFKEESMFLCIRLKTEAIWVHNSDFEYIQSMLDGGMTFRQVYDFYLL